MSILGKQFVTIVGTAMTPTLVQSMHLTRMDAGAQKAAEEKLKEKFDDSKLGHGSGDGERRGKDVF